MPGPDGQADSLYGCGTNKTSGDGSKTSTTVNFSSAWKQIQVAKALHQEYKI
jgi:hypothetical protein